MSKIFFLFYVFLFPFTLLAEKNSVLLVVGTRPEAIKMIPVYECLKRENIPVSILSTGQHLELVNEIFSFFQIQPEFSFNIMKKGQDLSYITEEILHQMKPLLQNLQPALVVVQGDTTSAMAAALSAFYTKIPVAHIEAGLRTHNIYAPFPEEMNRQLISKIASLHFAPTAFSKNNLKLEGIADKKIYQTGNTVVDALYLVKRKIEKGEIVPSKEIQLLVENAQKNCQNLLLFTAHRRESIQGGGLEEAMSALYEYLKEHKDFFLFYPVHPNPVIKEIINKTSLSSLPNVFISPPLCYPDLVYVLLSAQGVLTDSGGIQEEAVSLKKMTLVLRNETDRPEGLQDGYARLVGTNALFIKKGLEDIQASLLSTETSLTPSPYGEGDAAEKITYFIQSFLNELKT